MHPMTTAKPGHPKGLLMSTEHSLGPQLQNFIVSSQHIYETLTISNISY